MALIIWVKLRASARFYGFSSFLFKQCQGLHIRFKSDIKRPSGVAEGAKTVTQTQHQNDREVIQIGYTWLYMAIHDYTRLVID